MLAGVSVTDPAWRCATQHRTIEVPVDPSKITVVTKLGFTTWPSTPPTSPLGTWPDMPNPSNISYKMPNCVGGAAGCWLRGVSVQAEDMVSAVQLAVAPAAPRG